MDQISVSQFGGLRLDADPIDLGFSGAYDLRNVEFDRNGSVRSRSGVTSQTTGGTTPTTPVWLTKYKNSNVYAVIASGDVNTYNTTTFAAVDTEAGPAGPLTHAVEFGTASTSYLYVAGESPNLYRYDGTTLAAGASSIHAKWLAVTPWDSRLVAAYADKGATRKASRVFFSDPGDGDTFGATNYIDLTPNDGESIKFAVSWRDLLFVFKETKFFVFYGTGTDGTGGPIFNYRTVSTGIGCSEDYGACAARDGVYFVSVGAGGGGFESGGVYRTTGGPPELVSGAVSRRVLRGGINVPSGYPSPLFASRPTSSDERLYVPAGNGESGLWILDFATGTWTYWTLQFAPLMIYPTAGRSFVAISSTGGTYFQSVPLAGPPTTDSGTTFTSYYQSGFTPVADGKYARMRGFELYGMGTLTHGIATDMGSSDDASTFTLGTLSSSRGWDGTSRAGRYFSFKVSGTGSWLLDQWSGSVISARSTP